MDKRTRVLPDWLNVASAGVSDKNKDASSPRKRKKTEHSFKDDSAECNRRVCDDVTGPVPSCSSSSGEVTSTDKVPEEFSGRVVDKNKYNENDTTEERKMKKELNCSSSSTADELNNLKQVSCETNVEPLINTERADDQGVSGGNRECDGVNATNATDTGDVNEVAENCETVSCHDDKSSADPVQSASASQNITGNPGRVPCKYGTKCYRKNPLHRADFSHPGDDDYTTVDKRPECKYGLSCYRKNALHRQRYKHTQRMKKARQVKQNKKTKRTSDDDYDDDDDEEEEDDDLFLDDSSDDYNPSSSDSETDFSGVEEVDDTDKTK